MPILSAPLAAAAPRAVERRQVKRVGANDFRKMDLRVISATHKSLEREVAQGTFREDLYHRLAVVKVALPPLRERADDIPLLVDEFLRAIGKEPGAMSAQTRALLREHSWPGNVRELRNVVERAVSLGTDAALPAVGAVFRPKVAVDSARPFKQAKDELVAAFERDYVEDLLRRCEGNVSRAAREAGIDRVYLHRLLGKYGL